MVRMLKRFCGLLLLGLSAQQAMSFSLLGPFEDYQQEVLTYQVGGDLGGPHNAAEEFRRNTPVMYYAFDANFLDYFGSNGMASVESAIAIMNGLTNVSSYSADLSEFPLEAHEYNYLAQALQLTDIKSVALALLVENLGLAEPDRYTWTLHDRTMGSPCPAAGLYVVVKRNFDPVVTLTDQLQSSSYVNGTLYSYFIQEFCSGTPFLSDAVEVRVDDLANTFTAVAAFGLDISGGYYSGLTRDDMGGLRYLLRSGNRNIEAVGTNAFTFVTNTAPAATQLLFTSNLTELVSASLTNAPGALAALFPNLQIVSSTPIFTNVVTTNFFPYFYYYPGDPYGTVRLAISSSVTTNIQTWYSHQFGNVFLTPTIQLAGNMSLTYGLGHVASNGLVQVLTTNISLSACGSGQPYTGIPCTNVTTTTYVTNGVFGDYFIMPTNLCSVLVVATQLIQSVSFTNTVVATNTPTTTNIFNSQFSQSTISSFNQYVYRVQPVVCPENSVALREGVERIRFEKREYDSLLNRFFYPVTNTYVLNSITNNTLVPQVVQRVILTPDFLYTAQDLAGVPNNPVIEFGFSARNIDFDADNVNLNLAGPGVITPGTIFTFNKVGPAYLNPSTFFLVATNNYNEQTHAQLLIWGSFDGSTNAPVVFPNGTDLQNLENQIFINIAPAGPALPNGVVGINYTNQFSGFTVASGATPPYTWSLTGLAGLPANLSLNGITGQISGAPTTPGVYDFTIRMSDAAGRYVDRPYSLTISP